MFPGPVPPHVPSDPDMDVTHHKGQGGFCSRIVHRPRGRLSPTGSLGPGT